MYKPYPRQEEAINKMVSFINSKSTKKGLFVYPTSFGKSVVIANVAQKFPEKYFINIVPKKELLEQNYEKFTSYGYEGSICSASLGSNEIGQITFATIGTLKKHIDFFKDKEVVVLVDECFVYDTPIVTEEGVFKIGKLFDMQMSNSRLPRVKTINENTGEFEYKTIDLVKNNGEKETVFVEFHNSFKVECTKNHEFLTLNGWKHACDLLDGDAVQTSYSSGHGNSLPVMNKDQKDLFVGCNLGDGSFDYRSKRYSGRLKCIQGEKQKDYLLWKSRMFNKEDIVEKLENNGYSNTVAYRFQSSMLYIDSSINSYDSQIESLNHKSLAVLWMDDGHLSKELSGGSLYSLCSDKKLVEKLNKKIGELGIRDTVVRESKSSSTGRVLWYIQFRAKSLRDISKYCCTYIHKNLTYKVLPQYRDKVGTYEWDNTFKKSVKVFKKMTETDSKKEVFDMAVRDNHNYIVTTPKALKTQNFSNKKSISQGEGIIVHNCQNGSLKGSQLDKFVKKIKKCKLVGTTATPLRLKPGMGGSELKMMNRMRDCIFTSIEDVVQISEVVAEKKWSKLLYDVENIDESALTLNTTGTEYTLKSLKLFSEKNDIVSKCEAAVEKLIKEGRKSIIVYTSFIEEAEALQRKLNNCMALHSKMDKNLRTLTIDEFKKGNLQVIANVGILIEGFDHPELSAIVMARPTNSITIYYQSIGRLVRTHPDKKNAKVVDISGNFNKFGKVEDINYQESEYWGGWNAFSGDRLLTNYPLGNTYVPTKQSLKESWEREQEYKNKIRTKTDPEFFFGKYKGKKLSEVKRDKDGRSYLAWILEPKTKFTWYGEKGKTLKRAIEEEMQLV